MTTNDRDDLTGHGLGDLPGGLEQLARHFDAQDYPGQAWPAAREERGRASFSPLARPRTTRRLRWKIAGWVAAAAVLLALAVNYGVNLHPRVEPAPASENALALAPTPSGGNELEEPAIPEILIVEDLESYSIIDLSTGVPLVSFATKDSYSPACVVPLLPEPPLQGATVGKKT